MSNATLKFPAPKRTARPSAAAYKAAFESVLDGRLTAADRADMEMRKRRHEAAVESFNADHQLVLPENCGVRLVGRIEALVLPGGDSLVVGERRPQVHYGERPCLWSVTLNSRNKLRVIEHARTLGVHCRVLNGQYDGFHVLVRRSELEVTEMPYRYFGDDE